MVVVNHGDGASVDGLLTPPIRARSITAALRRDGADDWRPAWR